MQVRTKSANYCPECGQRVETAQEIAVDEDLAGPGLYERSGGHVIIGSGSVEIYVHAEEGE